MQQAVAVLHVRIVEEHRPCAPHLAQGAAAGRKVHHQQAVRVAGHQVAQLACAADLQHARGGAGGRCRHGRWGARVATEGRRRHRAGLLLAMQLVVRCVCSVFVAGQLEDVATFRHMQRLKVAELAVAAMADICWHRARANRRDGARPQGLEQEEAAAGASAARCGGCGQARGAGGEGGRAGGHMEGGRVVGAVRCTQGWAWAWNSTGER